MKLLGFINYMKTSLINEVDIDLKTFKLFLNSFINHLSNTEHEKHIIDLHYLIMISTKQISIDKNITNNIIKKLDKELNKLNGKNE